MAFDTYAGLQAEIINWYTKDGDTDFAAAVPGFIRLAENLFEQGSEGFPSLRTRDMEASTTLSLVNGSASLPADFLEARKVETGRRVLEMSVPSSSRKQFLDRAGQPEEYAITGGNIRVYPSATQDLTLDYYQKIPALSDVNTSNWLLAKSPMAYLFASLVFGATWSEDDASVQRYGNLYRQALTGLVSSDAMSKYNRVVSRARGYRP